MPGDQRSNDKMKMSKLKRGLCAVATFGALMASGAAHAELKAFYTFEGSLNDLSGNGYTGSSANGAGYAAGLEGQALDLDDALNQYVSVSGLDINPSSMPAITFGAWVNADAESAVRGVLSHDDGGFDRTIDIDFRGSSSGWSAFLGNGVVHGAPVTTGAWTFIALRHDQATGALSFNVDGVQVDVAGVTFGGGFGDFFIGRNPCCDAPLDGRIDNVFVYDEFLSDARLAEIRVGGASAIVPVPEPQAWLMFALGALVLGGVARRR
jgi:hypothetical protein